jgi:hypothetical protein
MPDPSPFAPEASLYQRARALPSQAICVYAEPLVVGRRVVVVGDASLGLGERLLELGARAVHVYDPQVTLGAQDERRGDGAFPRGLVVRGLPLGGFEVRDGSFDVAIVIDLGASRALGELLLQVRRVLGKGGVALIGVRTGSLAPTALDYYELYDQVALQFSHVRMIAEVPFAGVALADLSLEGSAPEVSVDTQLAGEAEAPERFFALASQEDVRLSEYAIVQLPLASAGPITEPRIGSSRERVQIKADPDSGTRAALAEAQLRAKLLEAQVEELKTRAARHSENQEHALRAAELDARLAEESVRLSDAEARAAEHFVRAERFSHEAREVGTELSREQDRATALEGALVGAEALVLALRGQLAEAEALLGQREADLREVLTELERVRGAAVGMGEAELSRMALVEARAAALDLEVAKAADEYGAELIGLERALQERARVVTDLEHEVARRERIVRELLGSLDDARSEGGNAPIDEAGSLAATRDLDLVKMELLTARRDLEAREASTRVATERAAALALANDELRARLDGLALDMARREGERLEIGWRVAELEQQISRLEAEQTELTVTIPPPSMGKGKGTGMGTGMGKPPDDSGLLAQRVVDLQEEIDVLRQAMAQEHEARVRAESGDELSKARAELARQAVLLEQLSRELDAQGRARQAESKTGVAREA